jgi:drug/metabolite transporter (DMT)-like permease
MTWQVIVLAIPIGLLTRRGWRAAVGGALAGAVAYLWIGGGGDRQVLDGLALFMLMIAGCAWAWSVSRVRMLWSAGSEEPVQEPNAAP